MSLGGSCRVLKLFLTFSKPSFRVAVSASSLVIGSRANGARLAGRLGDATVTVLGQAASSIPSSGYKERRAVGLVAEEGAGPSFLPYGPTSPDDARPTRPGYAQGPVVPGQVRADARV